MNGRATKQSKIGLHHQKAKTTQQGLSWFDRMDGKVFLMEKFSSTRFAHLCRPIAENVYGSSTI